MGGRNLGEINKKKKNHRGIQKARGSLTEGENADDLFILTLWRIIKKEQTFIHSQMPRFSKLWSEHLEQVEPSPHKIREIQVLRENFFGSDQKKIIILRKLELSLVDGYYTVKSVVETLFGKYFQDSELFLSKFKEEDRIPAKYLAAEALLGALLQFISSEKESVPLKYLIIAKNRSMLKLKGLTDKKILLNINPEGSELERDKINDLMAELVQSGYVERTTVKANGAQDLEGARYYYKWKKDFKLSTEGNYFYNSYINPIIAWTVQLWRSFYNIREIDVQIPENYKFRNFLMKTVAKAATQGFKSCYSVIKNIQTYYEMVIEDSTK